MFCRACVQTLAEEEQGRLQCTRVCIIWVMPDAARALHNLSYHLRPCNRDYVARGLLQCPGLLAGLMMRSLWFHKLGQVKALACNNSNRSSKKVSAWIWDEREQGKRHLGKHVSVRTSARALFPPACSGDACLAWCPHTQYVSTLMSR